MGGIRGEDLRPTLTEFFAVFGKGGRNIRHAQDNDPEGSGLRIAAAGLPGSYVVSFHNSLELYALWVIPCRMANRLAKRLKQLRAKQRLTQAALARRAGVTLSYIGRLEIGRHDPQLSTLLKLAKALRVKVAELVK